jgi:transposase-like protein
VVFIDATYQTNRYNMPLVHFLAVTSIGATTSVAMCFVTSENEQMYRWAVDALKELVLSEAKVQVFLSDDETALKNALRVYWPEVPQLLCVWHINMNVLAEMKDRWINRSEDYNQLAPEEHKKQREANQEKKKEFIGSWDTASTATN